MTRSGLVLALILVASGVAALRYAVRGGARSIEAIPLLSPPPPPPPSPTETPEIDVAEDPGGRAPSVEAKSVPAAKPREPADSVSGRVQWPGGRPASGCTIQLETRIPSPSGEGWISIETSSSDIACRPDGTFEIRVSERQPVTLTARTSSPPGFSHLSGVAPGTTGIVMTLEAGSNVSGRAVDDRGDPLARFTVVAQALDEPGDTLRSPSEAGSFTLSGLHDGAWEVFAEAQGHSRSTKRRIVLPADLGPVDLVLPRCAKVSGRVVLPEGGAASGSRIRSIPPRDLPDPFGQEGQETRANFQGVFLLENLDAGPQRIVASKDSLADSEASTAELRPGEHVQGLVLRLQRGGRIEGEVLDLAGRPLPGLPIAVSSAETGVDRTVLADEAGAFELEALAAGRYRLVAIDRSATADVVEGETTRVTIGGFGK